MPLNLRKIPENPGRFRVHFLENFVSNCENFAHTIIFFQLFEKTGGQSGKIWVIVPKFEDFPADLPPKGATR